MLIALEIKFAKCTTRSAIEREKMKIKKKNLLSNIYAR